jgi:hypothetical protein
MRLGLSLTIMKSNRTRLICGSPAIAAVLAVTAVGADSSANANDTEPFSEEALGQPVAAMDIPSEIDQSVTMNFCVKAASGRGWNIVSKKDNILTINLTQRGWEANVFFVIKEDVVVMYSDSYAVNKRPWSGKRRRIL